MCDTGWSAGTKPSVAQSGSGARAGLSQTKAVAEDAEVVDGEGETDGGVDEGAGGGANPGEQPEHEQVSRIAIAEPAQSVRTSALSAEPLQCPHLRRANQGRAARAVSRAG